MAAEYTDHALREINQQVGHRGLYDIPEYRQIEEKFGEAEQVEFNNYGLLFFEPRVGDQPVVRRASGDRTRLVGSGSSQTSGRDGERYADGSAAAS